MSFIVSLPSVPPSASKAFTCKVSPETWGEGQPERSSLMQLADTNAIRNSTGSICKQLRNLFFCMIGWVY
ncbi:hypothetical protein [Bacteroides eggerthii]|uniref:hypothetical protein n=1 Tax=Bacteroides eggerthii TaxID=28111 RepID=UPI001E45C1F4|nr:hypothetical protein [Bacteroides eggerthii]